MEFDLDRRTAALSVGEFSEFSIGPREGLGGPRGVWRAQLGTQWHQQLHTQTKGTHPEVQLEVPIAGAVAHRGWTIALTGRIDQILPATAATPRILREIKTVTEALPGDEGHLRSLFADYFVQLATYLSLSRIAEPDMPLSGQLLFVEIGAGTTQIVSVVRSDETLFTARLEALVAFLDLRWQARERLRTLRFRPAFTQPRPGQETTRAELETALRSHRFLAFEAPTGFGKTGFLLETALAHLRAGRFSRVLYLTGKSTGQLQVVRTLQQMTTGADLAASGTEPPGRPLAIWQVRAKAEHCVNTTFHCVRESCGYLAGAASRWPQSGLSRFYLLENHPRDLDALRIAGRDAFICPYEITRTALAFNDLWVGDYNYVFAPRNRGLFYEQPGFSPAQTFLIVDEAHNLPSRVADAFSHTVFADEAHATTIDLEQIDAPAPLRRAWGAWTETLAGLPVCDEIDLAVEDELVDLLKRIADIVANGMLDYAAMSPGTSERLWQVPELFAWLREATFQKLLWSPRQGELRFTCLDAAPAIGATLADYGAVVFASATFGPIATFGETVGLAGDNLVFKQDSGAGLVSEAVGTSQPAAVSGALGRVLAHTPWREGAYRVAYDLRVETTFKKRAEYAGVTASTVESLHAAADGAVVVFFSSYRYAESISRTLERRSSPLRVVLQPRGQELAAQAQWVDESLLLSDALFLVLGSSFAESVDLLGGRVSHAMVVGPALPEVNAVQRARIDRLKGLSSEKAFRRIYQIPGMQKVNQALGRLVRAPGQKAQVLLHCRRFAEPSYASLLATDYQFGTELFTDADLAAWLETAG